MSTPINTSVSFLQAVTMAVFNTAGLTASYAALNGSGFTAPVKVLKIYNGSTVGVTVSYNGGTTDQDYFPPGSTQILDCQTNHSDDASSASGTLYLKKGQILMGKGSAGVGNFYVIGYF